MIGFMDQRPPATEQAIQALEATIGRPLPPSYRTFLSSRDGGDPDPNVLLDTNGQPTDVGVSSFLSVSSGAGETSVAEAREFLFGDVGPAWLPIGVIEGGAYLLLGIHAPAEGVAEVDVAHGGQPKRIAYDFDDFLGRLVDFAPYMPDIDWSKVEVTKGPAAE